MLPYFQNKVVVLIKYICELNQDLLTYLLYKVGHKFPYIGEINIRIFDKFLFT